MIKMTLPAILTGIAVLMMAEPAHAGGATIPEPATVVMLGAGAVAVGALAWWRKRK